jgi:hypothetical protein
VLGLPFVADARYVARVVRGLPVDELPFALTVVDSALSPAAALVGDLGSDVVVIAATAASDKVGRSVLAAAGALTGPTRSRVVMGPVVTRLTDVGRSVADARRAMDLAVGLQMPDRCLSANSLTAQVVLGELLGRPPTQQLVADEIGPLLDHDRRTGARLVETLRVYLAHVSNKVSAAAALHVRARPCTSGLPGSSSSSASSMLHIGTPAWCSRWLLLRCRTTRAGGHPPLRQGSIRFSDAFSSRTRC